MSKEGTGSGAMSRAGMTLNPFGALLRAGRAARSAVGELSVSARYLKDELVNGVKAKTEGEELTSEYIEIAARVQPEAWRQISAMHRQAAVWLLACSLVIFISVATSVAFGYLFAVPAIFPCMSVYFFAARRAWLSHIASSSADSALKFNEFLRKYGIFGWVGRLFVAGV